MPKTIDEVLTFDGLERSVSLTLLAMPDAGAALNENLAARATGLMPGGENIDRLFIAALPPCIDRGRARGSSRAHAKVTKCARRLFVCYSRCRTGSGEYGMDPGGEFPEVGSCQPQGHRAGQCPS